ncbi:MAG: transcription antitermination factor NusB [Actinomycetota bacterium]
MKSHRRSASRRIALDALYAIDSGATAPVRDRTAQQIVDGVAAHREQVDELIRQCATGWTLERMPVIDRNILRLGIYEILYEPEVPVGAVANDCVDLAKMLSGEDSPRFVNAILSRVTREHPRLRS